MNQTLQHPVPMGKELTDIDLNTLSADDITKLKYLLATHGVVVVREQSLGDDEFVNFLQRLGTLSFTEGERPVREGSWLNVVSNVGRKSPPRSVFHTDTSYIARPPAYTALKAVTLPQHGGETLFSNQYLAFETLPASIKRQLADALVLHVASGVKLDRTAESQSWHPLFRKHPLSGKIALFLSTPERCQQIEGWDLAYSQRAIRLLYLHSIRPQRLYRHQWRSGDIVLWDNRCTMHRADHSQVVGDRILHRGLVSGEEPLGTRV
jgi:taurine dioxygenase